ncbi:MAG: DUF1080 domain-containing protein, partial [Verrucomicrobiota bacterium]
MKYSTLLITGLYLAAIDLASSSLSADIGVGASPIDGADIYFDGTRAMLDQKWTYWEGPRFGSSLPIKWKIVKDPVDEGGAMITDDPAAAGGLYG